MTCLAIGEGYVGRVAKDFLLVGLFGLCDRKTGLVLGKAESGVGGLFPSSKIENI